MEHLDAPFPFAWRDVALVHAACAVPLTWFLLPSILRRFQAAGTVVLAMAVLAAAAVPFVGVFAASLRAAITDEPILGIVVRAAIALGFTLAASLLLAPLIGRQNEESRQNGVRLRAVSVGLGIVLLFLPPAIYVRARCRHDSSKLGELLQQSRLGEAQTLAQALLVLDPRGQWKERPLSEVAMEIDRTVRQIESRTLRPLPFHATPNERLDRARHLAMLGRTDLSIEMLQSIHDPGLAPEVDNLLGAVYENMRVWEIALGSYRHAQAACAERPPSPARDAEETRALTGVAYCQRKLGHYAEAEASYHQMLAMSPTADSHFLLAQFYDDSQQAEKARTHARAAMALSPAHYQAKGEKLVRRLAVFHFGCLQVFAAENIHSGTQLPAAHYPGAKKLSAQ